MAGSRYAPIDEIHPGNVAQLAVAWTYRTGDVSSGHDGTRSTTAFEATPLMVGGTLFLCTPFNRVIALDADTGRERWTFDPRIDRSVDYANQLVCRGVAYFSNAAHGDDGSCERRIFTATNDGRLISLDASTGRPCLDFGESGQVDLRREVGALRWPGEYQVTSPPLIVGDLVIVGSAISDNQRSDAPSGVVRAFDARSGRLRWAWDLAPPDLKRDTVQASDAGFALATPNVWAPMSADPERDLLFVGTGNPASDYSRERGLDYFGSSVVALRASTGEVVWRFQTVHHDLWDYDVSAQPTLVTIKRGEERIPAVAQATKTGLLFVLERETGTPVFPIEERPVPQGGAPGEYVSPTQPFPTRPPPLAANTFESDAGGILGINRLACRWRMDGIRFDGIFTPPSLQPTAVLPGNLGGTNWGGVAYDPGSQLLLVNQSNVAFVVSLVPRADWEQERRRALDASGVEIAPQDGRPYSLRRSPLVSALGIPCNPPPWGTLAAVDLRDGTIRWQVPLGTTRDLAPLGIELPVGTPNLGGPIVTSSGLVFIAAAMDDFLRAFDLRSGAELWRGRLPAGGQATPMTYRAQPGGRQYVVVAAGGHGRAGTTMGDTLVAFALPRAD